MRSWGGWSSSVSSEVTLLCYYTSGVPCVTAEESPREHAISAALPATMTEDWEVILEPLELMGYLGLGDPVDVVIDGVKVSVRILTLKVLKVLGSQMIFALATIMSSVLIYNLPETIREADISRLSFAVEIAEEFYGRFGLL
ncbi:hypothetical protein KFK09_020968 [Dendrobium nobile]|uniref:Guanylate-binding protein N-terminal domain-containing protein n=1 Tax=Dendrobium nobile TaxID=94219 RepID=A0A8T3ANZ0_DENNO|nr:hypothetical protein KFK09_020968 [Dendrobium nobile]